MLAPHMSWTASLASFLAAWAPRLPSPPPSAKSPAFLDLASAYKGTSHARNIGTQGRAAQQAREGRLLSDPQIGPDPRHYLWRRERPRTRTDGRTHLRPASQHRCADANPCDAGIERQEDPGPPPRHTARSRHRPACPRRFPPAEAGWTRYAGHSGAFPRP